MISLSPTINGGNRFGRLKTWSRAGWPSSLASNLNLWYIRYRRRCAIANRMSESNIRAALNCSYQLHSFTKNCVVKQPKIHGPDLANSNSLLKCDLTYFYLVKVNPVKVYSLLYMSGYVHGQDCVLKDCVIVRGFWWVQRERLTCFSFQTACVLPFPARGANSNNLFPVMISTLNVMRNLSMLTDWTWPSVS